ncbi:hypothetical protein [Marimonas lutisalis]|uniref:hypothetical protein n=1 Tax=Marimonas lutisalis TaxID=2545756 RepID=UPI0010F8735C|nr:hypothetical protein [Marimonas lutisalis]
MQILIWGGAAVTLAGIAGLMWCILQVAAAKRENLEEDALRVRLARLVPVNLGALFVSAIGLMMVVIGIALG